MMNTTTSAQPFCRLIAVLGLCLAFSGFFSEAHAQADPVPVSLPDMADLEAGTSIEIPLTIDEPLVGEQAPVQSYDVTILYNSTVVDITGATKVGTLTEGWAGLAVNTQGENSVRLSSAATSSGALTEGVSGTFVILEAEVLADGTSPLAFTDFQISRLENDTDFVIPTQMKDGSVIVGAAETTGAVINEVLYDPPAGSAGDANGDGTRDAQDDEFVEIAGVPEASASVDLSGWTLSDDEGVVHTFPAGTVVAPGLAVTVFGGGTPADFSGLTQTASSGALGLTNSGDTVTLKDAGGALVAVVTWLSNTGTAAHATGTPRLNAIAAGVADESIARSPEFTGPFMPHTQISGTPFSPGARNDGGGSLPVEFAGAPTPAVEGRTVVLSWKTRTEINNAGFYVQHQHARAGGAWSEWATANPDALVEGAGTTAEPQPYEHVVHNLAPGRYRFRVQQVDEGSGARTPSPLSTEVEVAAAEGFTLMPAYPNPLTTGVATLSFSASEGETVEAALYNSLGQRVRLLDLTRRFGGAGEVRVRTDGLASGLYFVRLTTGDSERRAVETITVVR